MKKQTIVLAIAVFHSGFLYSEQSASQSQSLSEPALFERCYAQVTTLRVSRKHPLYLQVKAGQKTAIAACGEVIDRARFVGSENQEIGIRSDKEAKAVLATFHRLHASWFLSKDFPIVDKDGFNRDNQNLFDSTTPALFFTRALFRPSTDVKSALIEPISLRAIRTEVNPTAAPETGHSSSDYLFEPLIQFAPTGELLGVQNPVKLVFNYPEVKFPKPGRPAGTIDLNGSLGGGLLGTHQYLLLNTSPMDTSSSYKTDGGVHVHRRWGKAVFNDLLCREIPVVRESDVIGLVDTKSTIPFRTSSACTKCHASMDRAAATIRGYHLNPIGKSVMTPYGEKMRGGLLPVQHAVTASAEEKWPTEPDADYYRRPTRGVFYFRSYAGELIDRPVANVADLGVKISETDDFYICLAKRYYHHFTGITANNSDLGDPYRTTVLTAGDLAHRNAVIGLGKNLKSHQSLRQLISEILQQATYRKTDFGTSGVEDGK